MKVSQTVSDLLIGHGIKTKGQTDIYERTDGYTDG